MSKAYLPTVSIVTITQYSRRKCLENLRELIKDQIYKNIIEWVIVEGSKTQEDADNNAEYLESQADQLALLELNVIYIPYKSRNDEPHALSDLRNESNLRSKGDIIVCMDDDDYYPPTRVSHAVYRLNTSKKLIAGCSKNYIYFYETDQFFKFKGFGENHSINNCMAYKREYLYENAYDYGLNKAEESSFTKHFTEPMEQLEPDKCVVMSAHNKNTVDKSWMCNNSTQAGKNRMVIELPSSLIHDHIPPHIMERMKNMLK